MLQKRKRNLIFTLFFVAIALVLGGCGVFENSSGSSTTHRQPTTHRVELHANDPVYSDSVASNLVTGVLFQVSPNVSYQLSFNVDANVNPPELQLYRYTNYGLGALTRSLEATEENGRWVYSFVCEENQSGFWITSLGEGEQFYQGSVKNAKLEATGSYSTHFSVNLIVVGSYEGTKDSVSLDSLVKLLLSEFRRNLSPGGIFVDSLYVHHASERTDLSTRYPDDEPWRAGYSGNGDLFLSELGGWPDSLGEAGIHNALDLVLVHRIEDPYVLGYSNLFSGNFGGGPGSTVVVGTHCMIDSRNEYALKASEIINTAIHETAHFLGLRHTTASLSDQKSQDDYSIVEDGIEDTPYCGSVLYLKSLVIEEGLENNYLLPSYATPRYFAKNAFSCPDMTNPMFPASSDVVSDFTAGQLSVLAQMLQIYPH